MSNSKITKCEKCPNGKLIIKDGQYGIFFSCNNWPKCKTTLALWKMMFKVLNHTGINLYKWKKQCWKCNANTQVYTYFPSYQLNQIFPEFNFHFGGPEFLPSIDTYLKNKYSTINNNFSKTVGQRYISNNCGECNALQGRNFIVDDPHELWADINNKTLDSKYLYENITVDKCGLTETEIKDSCKYLI